MAVIPRAPRSRAFLRAVIRFQNGNMTVECTVRDLSDTGARLQLDEAIALPATFELDIPQRQTMIACELKWRKGGAAGVAFANTSSVEAPAQSRQERVEQLQAEIAALKRENTRLRELLEERGGA